MKYLEKMDAMTVGELRKLRKNFGENVAKLEDDLYDPRKSPPAKLLYKNQKAFYDYITARLIMIAMEGGAE